MNKSSSVKKHPVTSSSTVPHSFFSLQIEMLTNLRAEKQTFGERMAIDILLVAACTTFLEQIMAELLIKICYRAFYPGNQEPIYWRIFEGRVDAIKKGYFFFLL